MDFVAVGFSTLVNVLLMVCLIAGVSKLFQIHTMLTDIRDALKSRPVAPHANALVPTPLQEIRSGDEMLRELDTQLQEDELRNALRR